MASQGTSDSMSSCPSMKPSLALSNSTRRASSTEHYKTMVQGFFQLIWDTESLVDGLRIALTLRTVEGIE